MSLSRSSILHPVTKPPTAPWAEGVERYRLQPHFSVRHAHLLRMHDLLNHLVSLPPSYANSVQSLRAWRALAKCKEIDLRALFQTGAKILERTREVDDEDQEGAEEQEWRQGRRAEWLKWNQEGKWDKVEKMSEYILSLAAAGKIRYALEELDSFLPAHPYHDSITLNTLAGLLSLLIAQPSKTSASSSDSSEDDSDTTSQATKRKRIAAVPASEVMPLCTETAPDSTMWLQATSLHSAGQLDTARDYFRTGARLERKNPELSFGEATRWLSILDSSTSRGKRSRSDSFSPSPEP